MKVCKKEESDYKSPIFNGKGPLTPQNKRGGCLERAGDKDIGTTYLVSYDPQSMKNNNKARIYS